MTEENISELDIPFTGENNPFTRENENSTNMSKNPRKLAKQLRNDPKMLNFINDYKKGLLTNDISDKLTPKEKLQKRLNNIKMSRMSQVGQTYVKENKKDDIQKKIDNVKNKIEEDKNKDTELNLTFKSSSDIRKSYITKMKKLQKKYGKIEYSKYLQLIEDNNKSPDPHLKNLIDLYNYQNPKKEEQVLEFSDDDNDTETN
jgi:hypothetical protein